MTEEWRAMNVWDQDHVRYRALNGMLRALFTNVGTLQEFLRYHMDRQVAAAAEFIPDRTSLARGCAVAAQELVRHGFYRPADFGAFLSGFPDREDEIQAAAEACGVRWSAVAGTRRLSVRGGGDAAPHAIIYAPLDAELAVLRALVDGWEEREDREGLPYAVATKERADRPPLRLAAISGGLGDGAAARVRALHEELAPRCIAACGTCTGVRGRVFLGDVIVADTVLDDARRVETFHLARPWRRRARILARSPDWQAGLQQRRPASLRWQRDRLLKLLQEHEAPIDPRAHPELLEDQLAWRQVLQMVQPWVSVQHGRLSLNPTGQEWVADYFLRYAYQIPSDPPFAAHVGPIAAGVPLGREPAPLGVETELSGVAAVIAATDAPALLVEAVADFTDEASDDARFQAFASEASARFLIAFLTAYL